MVVLSSVLLLGSVEALREAAATFAEEAASVRWATSVAQATEVLRGEEIALVVASAELAKEPPASLVQALRAAAVRRKVQVVFVAAKESSPGWTADAYRADALDVLEAPLAPAVTAARLRRALRLARELAGAGPKPPEPHFAKALIDRLFVFVGVLSPDGTVVEANAAPLRAAGIALADVRGKKFWDTYWWTHSDDVRSQLREACRRASRGEVVRYDVDVRVAEDARMRIDFQIAPLFDEAGRITHLVPSAVDITARVRAEDQLKQQGLRMRRLFETNLLGILYWDLAGGVFDANDEFLRIVGYDRADLVAGRINWSLMTPEEHQAQDARAVEELRATGSHAPVEKEYFRKDGSRVWVLVGSATTDGENGVGFVMDISARKRAEAALRDSEARAVAAATAAEAERRFLDAVLEATPVGIGVADANGRLVKLNPANHRLWGHAPMSESVDAYRAYVARWADGSPRHGQLIEPHEWALARALGGQFVNRDVVEIVPFDAPGKRRTTLNSAAPVRDDSGKILGAVVAQMDITDRIEVERALRESEAQARQLVDNLPELAWMAEPDGNIDFYNQRWYEYTGTTAEEMRGWGWEKVHDPAILPTVVERWRRSLDTGEPFEMEFPMRGADGVFRWFLTRIRPLRNADGEIVRWFGSNTNVDGLRRAEAALREADRRKDEFIAILAHELRNPLAPVRTAVEILRRVGPSEPRLARARDIIDRQVTHMARLIDDLLDVSRMSRGKLELRRELCDVAAIARQTAEDYRASLEQLGLKVTFVSASGPAWVDGDPIRIAQMIGNLLNNAGRFTPAGGTVVVHSSVDERSASAVVEVEDTGIGIDRPLLDRLFDPFSQAEQDLARSKGGLGLGLALTKGLAELHGGSVSASSAGAGQGATFTLRFPLGRRSDVGRDSANRVAPRATRRLEILVIEDNHDAAHTLKEILELDGHAVRLAFDGGEGLAAAAAGPVDVVISDIGLPGALDGYAVGRHLRGTFGPSLLLVALSGYATDEARIKSQEAGFDVHLIKPVDLAKLARALLRGTAPPDLETA